MPDKLDIKLEIKNFGGQFTIVLSQPQMVQLGLSVGDFLDANVLPDGRAVLELDQDFTKSMKIARDVMVQYHDTLAELAKS